MKRIKSDKIVLRDSVFEGYVYFAQGKIAEISKGEHPVDEEFDRTGYYVSPGWIDLHTHGGGGFRFDGDVEEVINACHFHLRHGTATLCPTVSAAPLSEMETAISRIGQAKKDPRLNCNIVGAHAEGPYLSKKQAGAQCPFFITPPIKEEYLTFLERQGKNLVRWTYAPENDADRAFTRILHSYGIKCSAGHTDATYEELLPAFKEGCNLVTHLYSCTSTVTRDHGFRHLGVIESAFLLDDMDVEIICDGKHLPPELIKLIYKIKGPQHIALITDSLSLAGTDQTHGFMQKTEYIIEDGVCKLMDRSAFAGSIATADRLVRVAVYDAKIPLIDAVRMITETPARIMNLSQKGILKEGFDADFVVFDEDIRVRDVFVGGNHRIENEACYV